MHEAVHSVLDWYKETSWKGLKANEWSVIAGIVLEKRSSQSFKVIAVGIGTQCCSQNKCNPNGFVLHDSHAEILAKRSFERYLYRELLQASESELLEWNERTKRFGIGKAYGLHLYVSEAPCGDCCLYPIAQSSPPQAKKRRITGAKLASKEEESFQKQRINELRTKPGKHHMEPRFQTNSMSCSDKIASWNVFGLQGTFLSAFLEPIYLESVIVSQDPSTTSEDMMQTLHRSLCHRIAAFQLSPQQLKFGYRINTNCRYRVTPLYFNRNRWTTSIDNVSNLSLNWCLTENHWNNTNDIHQQLHKRFSVPEIEITTGAFGLREGANVKRPPTKNLTSRLCKASFYQAFHLLVKNTKKPLPYAFEATDTYFASKKKIALHCEIKERLYSSLFDKWIRTNQSLLQFTNNVDAKEHK